MSNRRNAIRWFGRIGLPIAALALVLSQGADNANAITATGGNSATTGTLTVQFSTSTVVSWSVTGGTDSSGCYTASQVTTLASADTLLDTGVIDFLCSGTNPPGNGDCCVDDEAGGNGIAIVFTLAVQLDVIGLSSCTTVSVEQDAGNNLPASTDLRWVANSIATDWTTYGPDGSPVPVGAQTLAVFSGGLASGTATETSQVAILANSSNYTAPPYTSGLIFSATGCT